MLKKKQNQLKYIYKLFSQARDQFCKRINCFCKGCIEIDFNSMLFLIAFNSIQKKTRKTHLVVDEKNICKSVLNTRGGFTGRGVWRCGGRTLGRLSFQGLNPLTSQRVPPLISIYIIHVRLTNPNIF